jgi:hypothetical protein
MHKDHYTFLKVEEPHSSTCAFNKLEKDLSETDEYMYGG